jgi:hypothetical protein
MLGGAVEAERRQRRARTGAEVFNSSVIKRQGMLVDSEIETKTSWELR